MWNWTYMQSSSRYLQSTDSYQKAKWNLAKGPSNTLIKLFNFCEEAVTIQVPQTIAIAHLFAVSASMFHQINQIFNAKDDVGMYKTIGHF